MTHKKKLLRTRSSQETHQEGKRIGKNLKRGLICLYGELGTGKTTFVRGLAEGLGITSRIQSPTFTYQRVHEGPVRLYHFDCYRIPENTADALIMQEIYEALGNNDGVIVIEWSERVREALPHERTDIFFEYGPDESRIIRMHEEEGRDR